MWVPEEEQDSVLEYIETFKGRGTELISLYIPNNKNILDVKKGLKKEVQEAENIKSKKTRQNVKWAIESILFELNLLDLNPLDLAIFCSKELKDKETNKLKPVFFIFELKNKLKKYIYSCNSTFFTEPLRENLKKKRKIGLLVLEKKEATFAFLQDEQIVILKRLDSKIPSKHRAGGQSALRFERVIENIKLDFFLQLKVFFLDFFSEGVDSIFIGGPGLTKQDFTKEMELPRELTLKIGGLVDTSYSNEQGIKELLHKIQDQIKDFDIIRLNNLFEEYLISFGKKDKLLGFGIEEFYQNYKLNNLKKIMINRQTELNICSYFCETCLKKKEKIKKNIIKDNCEDCFNELKNVETNRVVDLLLDLKKKANLDVEFINSRMIDLKEKVSSIFEEVVFLKKY